MNHLNVQLSDNYMIRQVPGEKRHYSKSAIISKISFSLRSLYHFLFNLPPIVSMNKIPHPNPAKGGEGGGGECTDKQNCH